MDILKKPKNIGGLGIVDLDTQNKCLFGFVEGIYITSSPIGVGLHSPLTYEIVYITP
jgi:hypothetical protein